MSELNSGTNEKDDAAGDKKNEGCEMGNEFDRPAEETSLDETIRPLEVRKVDGFQENFPPSLEEVPLVKPDGDDESILEQSDEKTESAQEESPGSHPDERKVNIFCSWFNDENEPSRSFFEKAISPSERDETIQEWFDKQSGISPIHDDSQEGIHSQQSPLSPAPLEETHAQQSPSSPTPLEGTDAQHSPLPPTPLPACPIVPYRSAFANVRNSNPFPRITRDDCSVINRYTTEKDPKPGTSSDFSGPGLLRSKSQTQAGPSSDTRGISQEDPKGLLKVEDPHKYYPISGTQIKMEPEYFARPGTSKDSYPQSEKEKPQKEPSSESDMEYTDFSDDESAWSSKSSPSRAATPASCSQKQCTMKRSDLYHRELSPLFEYHSYWDTIENRRIKYRVPMNERAYHESLQNNEKMLTTWSELTRIRDRESAQNGLKISETPTELSSDWDSDTEHTKSGSNSDQSPIKTEKNDPAKPLMKQTAEWKLPKFENSTVPTLDGSMSQPMYDSSRKSINFVVTTEEVRKSEGQLFSGATAKLFSFGSQSIFGFQDSKKEEKRVEKNDEEACLESGKKAALDEPEKKEALVESKMGVSLAVAEKDEAQNNVEPFECQPPLLSESRDESVGNIQ